NEEVLSSFNFGGIKVRLPDGQEVHLFNTWLWHAPYAWGLTNKTVGEINAGTPRSHNDDAITGTDLERRLPMAQVLLEDRLPTYLRDDNAPIILAGDLNTLPYSDWTGDFAD